MENIEHLTGLRLELTTTLPVPPSTLWNMVIDVPRIGSWSPECLGAVWLDGAAAAAPGVRFAAENRFGNDEDAVVLAVQGVVTEVVPERSFGWTMLDDEDAAGSFWRYELDQVDGGTLVRHAWEHGPGMTGMRDDATTDPASVDRRLGTLASNMRATLVAMETAALGTVA